MESANLMCLVTLLCLVCSSKVSSQIIGGSTIISCVPNDDTSKIESKTDNDIFWTRVNGSAKSTLLIYHNQTGQITVNVFVDATKYSFDTTLFTLKISNLDTTDCALSYECVATSGYVGDATSLTCKELTCQPPNPCLNGGTCTETAGVATCQCPSEKTGVICETDVTTTTSTTSSDVTTTPTSTTSSDETGSSVANQPDFTMFFCALVNILAVSYFTSN